MYCASNYNLVTFEKRKKSVCGGKGVGWEGGVAKGHRYYLTHSYVKGVRNYNDIYTKVGFFENRVSPRMTLIGTYFLSLFHVKYTQILLTFFAPIWFLQELKYIHPLV